MKEITKMTARRLAAALAKREVSAKEAAKAYLGRIGEADGEIGAYLTVTRETALEQADRIDGRRLSGEALSPLAGVPAGIKDNICTKGVRTTCASKMLANFVPPYSAAVMEKLADTVMLGKLNMDEFAMGSSTESSYFKLTRNPADLSRVPGGSSGGSAAAVAAGMCAFALGSDTGGSIRQPAAFCGVVGMKPTYGTVSRYGLVAFASSLDQIGPLTKDVADSAAVLNALAGWDRRDATCLKREYGDFSEGIGRDVKGMRLALPKEYFAKGIAPEVKEAVYAAARAYEKMGCEVEEVSLPSLSMALPAYYILSNAEASSNLARFDGVKYGCRAAGCKDVAELCRRSRSEGFGAEVKRRIMLGTFALSSGYYDAYYKKAQQVRTLVARDFARVLEHSSFVLAPVAPTTAYRIGEKTSDPLAMYLGDIYTVPVNIAGLPALSMPCGTDGEGLPIGMQLIGGPFSEALLYRAAYAFEQQNRKGACGDGPVRL